MAQQQTKTATEPRRYEPVTTEQIDEIRGLLHDPGYYFTEKVNVGQGGKIINHGESLLVWVTANVPPAEGSGWFGRGKKNESDVFHASLGAFELLDKAGCGTRYSLETLMDYNPRVVPVDGGDAIPGELSGTSVAFSNLERGKSYRFEID